MKPIRSERHREVAQDPWQGAEKLLEQKQVDHQVSSAGGLESDHTTHRIASGCGCLRPAAGFCAVCGATACEKCFGFCVRCHKPLCPNHMNIVDAEGSPQVQCRPCRESVIRQRRLSGALRLLLAPFIHFEDRHGPR